MVSGPGPTLGLVIRCMLETNSATGLRAATVSADASETFMDEARYNERGNEVTLVKRASAGQHGSA